MERILIKHLKGSKANQIEIFPLPLTTEISFGRDQAAQVAFDALKEDVVSRSHARLSQDAANPAQFTLADLGSRNGTYVNGKRIAGSVRIDPGDVIEFGTNGPQVQFDIDPRPANLAPATRMIGGQTVVPAATRESRLAPATAMSGKTSATGAGAESGKPNVGKATVERMIETSKGKDRKVFANVAIIVVALVLVGGALLGYLRYRDNLRVQQQEQAQKAALEAQLQKQKAELEAANKKNAENQKELAGKIGMTPAEIARKYDRSTVHIDLNWKLMQTGTGKVLFHQEAAVCKEQVRVRDKKTGKTSVQEVLVRRLQGMNCKVAAYLPMYISFGKHIEPYMNTLDRDPVDGHPYQAVGGSGEATGFVVTGDGFILTNRHVAAAWQTRYEGADLTLPGWFVFCSDQSCGPGSRKEMLIGADNKAFAQEVSQWVPANTSYLGGEYVGVTHSLDGVNEILDVKFADTSQPIRAKLVSFSQEADVALIKIDVPSALAPVKLSDDPVNQGDQVTVLGYPAVSKTQYVAQKSADIFHPQSSISEVPQPTASTGTVQRLLNSSAKVSETSLMTYFSSEGDYLELGINTTGPGNSGGPVFNSKGEVVGIFDASWSDYAGTRVTAALPIRYGKELLHIQPAIQ
ncbi:MAG: trypsin-like peptidase domain-containing protein [Syntrophobacteraceae bacterium]|nr:trypsin-like peptidase domain-containing protein [Syntrophobacteraceae bacterium]